MSESRIITTYLPTYRTPPPPVQAVNWTQAELQVFGSSLPASVPRMQVDKRAFYYSQHDDRRIPGYLMHALAKRYISQHPEMLIVSDDEYKKAYAKSQLYAFANEASMTGTSVALQQGLVYSINPPDDMLGFEYALCGFTVNISVLMQRMKSSTVEYMLDEHIRKRASDRRYKFMHNKQLKKTAYWKNPDNWTGFSAGFILDFYVYRLLSPHYRWRAWRLPQLCWSESDHDIASVFQIDPRLVKVFTDRELAAFIAETWFRYMPAVYFNQYTVCQTPIDPEFDSIITGVVQDPDAFKQQLQERRRANGATSTQGQQGQVLQGTPYSVGQGIQVHGIAQVSPADTPTRSVPVYGTDGQTIIGRAEVPVEVNDARRELNRMLAELRATN